MDDEKVNIIAEKKKRSLFNNDTKKVKDYFIEKAKEDALNALTTFAFNSLDMISNLLKQTVQDILMGENSAKGQINPQNTYTRTNYQGIYKKQNPYAYQSNQQSTPMSLFNRNVYDYENVEFETQAMASYCLMKLKQYIAQKGYVEVGIFYQEARLPYTNVDMNYGWNNLDSAVVQRQPFSGKWIIILPKAIEIEKD